MSQIKPHGNTTHGMRHTRIYSIWCDMKKRCYNPNHKSYSNYGAKGITVCSEWKNDFVSFYNWSIANGYTDMLTIDRIDTAGIYAPSNCRWVSHAEQQRNRNNNVYVTYNGEKVTISELSRLTGISANILYSRKDSALRHKGTYTAEDLLTPQKYDRIYTDKYYSRSPKPSRKINQYSLDGTFIKCIDLKDVDDMGFNYSAVINCLNGRAKSSGGYKWSYAD